MRYPWDTKLNDIKHYPQQAKKSGRGRPTTACLKYRAHLCGFDWNRSVDNSAIIYRKCKRATITLIVITLAFENTHFFLRVALSRCRPLHPFGSTFQSSSLLTDITDPSSYWYLRAQWWLPRLKVTLHYACGGAECSYHSCPINLLLPDGDELQLCVDSCPSYNLQFRNCRHYVMENVHDLVQQTFSLTVELKSSPIMCLYASGREALRRFHPYVRCLSLGLDNPHRSLYEQR